jgi:hypothetical protein
VWLAVTVGPCAGCGPGTDPFLGNFVGPGQAFTGDANGAAATTQSGSVTVQVVQGPGVDGGVGADGGAATPYIVHVSAAFEGAPVGAADCVLGGLFGSGPTVVLVAAQTCSVSVDATRTTLTLFTGELTWDGATLHATLIWTLANRRSRWVLAATPHA